MSNDDVKPNASGAEEPAEPEKPAAARKRAPARKAADDDAAVSSPSAATPRRSSSKTGAKAAETAAAASTATGAGEGAPAGAEGDTPEAPEQGPSSRRTSRTKRSAAESRPAEAEPTADEAPVEPPSATTSRRGRHVAADTPEPAEGSAAPPAAELPVDAPASQEPAAAKRPRRATSKAKEVPPESAAATQDAAGPTAGDAGHAPATAPEPARAQRAKAHPLTPAAEAPPTERTQAKPESATEPPTETPSPDVATAEPATPGAGAEPTATQPSAQSTTPVLPDLPPASMGERKEYRGSGRRVVVAEDEALIRLDVVETLTEAGFDVVGEAGDGERAVALATELRPDVVVMDIKMPVLDGISAAERIGKARIAPVVLLTAFSQAELVERARDAGAMAYVVKPFTPAELLPAIEIAVARHQEITALESEVADLAERFETRKRVERAKGLLMTKMGLTEPESFRWIQKTSMDRRLTMREVADAVIEQVGGGDKNR